MTRDVEDLPVLFETPRLDARRLRPGDEEVLQEVFRTTPEYFITVTGRAEVDPDAAERELQAAAGAEGREVALLTLRETGAGVGALGWWGGQPEPGLSLLGMVLLVPEERGKGLAREAVEGLEGWFGAQGMDKIRTGVVVGHQRARAMLEALGFTDTEERTHVPLPNRARMMITFYEKDLP